MEKKVNRNATPTSRSSNTDSKKILDGTGGKLWPRGGHRREPAGSSLATKAEPFRKPQPQRSKTTSDKRPKPRSTYTNYATAPSSGTGLEPEQEYELGSIFLPGSKKQSLNHLLNFFYTPRQVEGPVKERPHKTKQLMETKKHKYNKEHFLQANCQFVVNESGDYRQYLVNPDALVDWNLIEQVNLQVSEEPLCPICLYPPTAAKMTRCGHIYCWSCVLHYLALSEKSWHKCPICHEAVHKKDLKSVVAIPHATFTVNETITFKLMKRARGCLTAYPVDDFTEETTISKISNPLLPSIYSKLLLANTSNILSFLEREKKELNKQLKEDETSSERCFIEEALELLKERETNTFKLLDQKEDPIKPLEKLGGEEKQIIKHHFFYQACDGQHLYLHALNARMLEHTYGSLEFCPKTISGKILEKEGGSMTEELRKKLRYLQHLPLTCQFEVAEIQLRQPAVSKDTLDMFQGQIEIRRKVRQRRAKEEKRREKRYEEKMGRNQPPDLHLESPDQFPEMGFEPRLRTESECTQQSESSSSPDLSSLSLSSKPSFANMLAKEKNKAPAWPGLGESSRFTPIYLNKPMMATTSSIIKSDSDVELEDYEPVPSFNKNFGDAIAEALQKASQANSEEGATSSNKSSKKNKKKSKQKVLFATNMAYSG